MTDVSGNSGSAKKSRQAEHYLIDAAGAVVEEEEKATGIRYVDIGSKVVINQQTGGKAGEPITMWACFGLKTLATNVASQARQNGRDATQVQEIKDRFALNEAGTWMDRTREVAPTDLDKLADAVAGEMVSKGKITPDQEGDYIEKMRAALEDENTVKVALAVPEVRARYNQLVGRNVKTVDDLAKVAGL